MFSFSDDHEKETDRETHTAPSPTDKESSKFKFSTRGKHDLTPTSEAAPEASKKRNSSHCRKELDFEKRDQNVKDVPKS